jgi:choline/ethanolamine kinase
LLQSLGLPRFVARAMTCQELKNPLYSSTIARKLASVHSLNVPINKEPVWLFETSNRWLENMRSNITPDNIDTFKNSVIKDLCEFDYEKELKWLEKFLLSCNSPVVFSHNDLQEGNILLPEMSSTKLADRMVFIDFEFCSYNYRGFDIGNHFCERMFDYSNPEWPHYYTYLDQYPDDKTRRAFIREYLKQWNERYAANSDPELNTEDHLLTEADYYTLASHMLWTLWSINNALTSEIKFGYWEYGKTRLEEYLKHKNFLLKNLSDSSKQ